MNDVDYKRFADRGRNKSRICKKSSMPLFHFFIFDFVLYVVPRNFATKNKKMPFPHY